MLSKRSGLGFAAAVGSILLITTSVAFAEISSPTNPPTLADDATIGATAWSNPGNASSLNGAFATVALNNGSNKTSHYLKATNFGFSIPAGSTINGIQVQVTRSAAAHTNTIKDNVVRIVKSGTIITAVNRAGNTNWGTSTTTITYGGTSDLWGATSTSTWTASDINSAATGVVFSAQHSSGGDDTAQVDFINMTVFYTPPTATLVTITPGTLPNGTVNVAYSQTLTASTTASGPFTWSVATGTLPAGLVLNTAATGATSSITGTPTTVSTSTFSVKVTNGVSSSTQSYTVHVNPGTAGVALSGLSQTFNGSPKTVTVTTTPNGLSNTVTYNGSGTAPTDAGSYAIVATVTDPNYNGNATGTLVINKADQTITFGALADKTVGDPVSVSATSDSGLTVTFTAAPTSTCTVVGVTVDLIATGTCTISAHQAGNANFNAAPDVSRSFNVNAAPVLTADLILSKSDNSGQVFHQGDIGDQFVLQASNVNATSTDGSTVTVTDTMPTGITATAATGTGWTCSIVSQTVTCTRNDVLAGFGSYDPITVTVNVDSNAPASITNTATVAGGGETNTTNDSGSDIVTVNAPVSVLTADLILSKSDNSGQVFHQGDIGDQFVLQASNVNATSTDGSTVTVTDTMPTGITATGAVGTGWNCSVVAPLVTCTRNDVLAGFGSYDPITVTVNVDSNAPASITNTATVAGGGETNTANDSGSDTVTVNGVTPSSTITLSPLSGAFSNGQVNTAYVPVTITATNSANASDTFAFAVTAGSLPTGLALTTAGDDLSASIGGIPVATGTFNFDITATSTGTPTQGATQSYSITIDPAPVLPPTPTSTLNVTLVVDNSAGGTATSSDFLVTIIAGDPNPANFPGSAAGAAVTVDAATAFGVNVSSIANYSEATNGSCADPSGILVGTTVNCVVTETFTAPIVPPPSNTDNSPSVAVGAGGNFISGGEVLGASTSTVGTDTVGTGTPTIPATVTAAFHAAACSFRFDKNLRQGMTNADVKNLQIAMNYSPLTQVATTGAGSPGNETTFFGSLTRNAVIAFQNIFASEILAPAGLTSGTGFVGPFTRAKLNQLCGQ